MPGVTGRFLSEFGLVVVVATLTSLAVSFTITPALAGNWSLLSAHGSRRASSKRSRAASKRRARGYSTHVLDLGAAPPRTVMVACVLAVVGAIALVPLHVIGFEFMPADRSRRDLRAASRIPTGTPLATTNAAIADLTQQIANDPRRPAADRSTAGSDQAGFGGSVKQGSVGQIQVFLKDNRKHSTDYWATALGELARKKYAPEAQVVAIPATGTGGGNSQPIDYIVTSDDDEPDP